MGDNWYTRASFEWAFPPRTELPSLALCTRSSSEIAPRTAFRRANRGRKEEEKNARRPTTTNALVGEPGRELTRVLPFALNDIAPSKIVAPTRHSAPLLNLKTAVPTVSASAQPFFRRCPQPRMRRKSATLAYVASAVAERRGNDAKKCVNADWLCGTFGSTSVAPLDERF